MYPVRRRTFYVTGEATFAAGSTFAVNVAARPPDDKLVSTGSTTLSGAAIAVSGASGTYLPSTHYTLLTAEGGLSGTFSSVLPSGYLATLAFLAPTLSYDANDVYLGFSVLPFVTAAQTPNQVATALALQAQPAGSPLYDALISQTKSSALGAFNALSGEVHGSAIGAAFDDTRLPREAVLDRLAESYAAPSPSGAKSVQTYAFSTPTQVYSAWAQGFLDFWGHLGGQRQFRDAWQQHRRFHPRRRCDALWPLSPWRRRRLRQFEHLRSVARFDRQYLSGLHRALRRRERRRAAIAWRRLLRQQSRTGFYRAVSFSGFYQSAGSGYAATPLRLSARRAGGSLSPCPGSSLRRSSRSSVSRGSLSMPPVSPKRLARPRLSAVGERGLRDHDAWAAQRNNDVRDSPITLNGMIGWQHVYGGPTPNATMAFASAPSTSFSVAGSPIARDVFALGSASTAASPQTSSSASIIPGFSPRAPATTRIKAKLEATF